MFFFNPIIVNTPAVNMKRYGLELHIGTKGPTSTKHCTLLKSDLSLLCVPPRGWATPRYSAILGQPVGLAKQASLRVPGFKN